MINLLSIHNMFAARCPYCNTLIKVERNIEGQKCKCPACEESMIIARQIPQVGYSDMNFATKDDDHLPATQPSEH